MKNLGHMAMTMPKMFKNGEKMLTVNYSKETLYDRTIAFIFLTEDV